MQQFTEATWKQIRLAVFDVDGTLYNQSRLRFLMARDIILHSLLHTTPEVLAVVRTFRRIREELAEEEVEDFHNVLVKRTAAMTRRPPELVEKIAMEWLELRPLRHLMSCRYPALNELFSGLEGAGKKIGVLSDYPAAEKLLALDLTAEYIVSATDTSVGMLKPNTKGLRTLIDAVGVQPEETVLIGDRPERDGMVAKRSGTWVLIRSSKPIHGWQCFSRYDDQIFSPVLVNA